jgi:hypothetical protein
MTDPTKLHRLFSDIHHEENEARYPVRAYVQAYDGTTIAIVIPSFDGGHRMFSVDYVGANFQTGDLILVVQDEADTYWFVSSQYVPVTTSATPITSSQDAGGGSGTGGVGSLPKNADVHLSKNQQQFAARLQADIGLEPCVICGWLLSEESGKPAQAPNGANNWLNIGAFDSGNWAGGKAPVWNTPVSGADATASFILGKQVNGVNAPSHASSGITNGITGAVGKSINAQITALQTCGWATSGYPNLPQVVGYFR